MQGDLRGIVVGVNGCYGTIPSVRVYIAAVRKKRRGVSEAVHTSHFRLRFCLSEDLFISPLTENLIVILLTTRLVGLRLLRRESVQPG